jgi:isopentenyl-diphosphate delta-isomerase
MEYTDASRDFAVDYVMFLTHDPKMDINPNEVSATRWVSKADLEAFFQDPGESRSSTRYSS